MPKQWWEHPIHGNQQMPAEIAKGAIFLLCQIGGKGLQRLLSAALPRELGQGCECRLCRFKAIQQRPEAMRPHPSGADQA